MKCSCQQNISLNQEPIANVHMHLLLVSISLIHSWEAANSTLAPECPTRKTTIVLVGSSMVAADVRHA